MHGNALISDIRGLFPKDNAQWLNWIAQGRHLYLNKEKVQNLINQQRRNLADVKYLDLDYVAKLIKDFDNPKINTKTNSKNELSMRDGEGASNSQLTEQQRKEMRELAEKIAKEFHIPLTIIDQVEKGSERMKRAKAWHNNSTGESVIVLNNNHDIEDVKSSIFHEVVAHKGLRDLVGRER